MSPLAVRPAEPADLPRLTEIYNHYVTGTAVTFDLEPFTVEARRTEWFDHYGAAGRHRLLVAVAVDGDAVLGYASSSPFARKGAYQTSVETSVYCAPEAVGRGVGSRLYEALFAALAAEDLHRAYAGITLPNEPSLRLHRRFGFTDVGLYREVGRKFGRYWDVLRMVRPL